MPYYSFYIYEQTGIHTSQQGLAGSESQGGRSQNSSERDILQVVHFCLTTYNFCLGLPVLQSCIAIHYLQVLSPKLKMMLLIDPALLYHTSIHSSFI